MHNMMTGAVCFEQKLLFVVRNLGIYPSCVKIFLAQYAYMMTGAVCFEQKLLFVVRNLGI